MATDNRNPIPPVTWGQFALLLANTALWTLDKLTTYLVHLDQRDQVYLIDFFDLIRQSLGNNLASFDAMGAVVKALPRPSNVLRETVMLLTAEDRIPTITDEVLAGLDTMTDLLAAYGGEKVREEAYEQHARFLQAIINGPYVYQPTHVLQIRAGGSVSQFYS